MHCERLQYVGGVLPVGGAALLLERRRLSLCPDCSAALASYLQVVHARVPSRPGVLSDVIRFLCWWEMTNRGLNADQCRSRIDDGILAKIDWRSILLGRTVGLEGIHHG